MKHRHLVDHLKNLRLSGLIQTLDVRLQQARSERLDPMEFLELIVSDELERRKNRLLDKRLQKARFPQMKTLETFDFSFNPSIPRRQIYDLATGTFIPKQENILFLGPPGVGKSHLAIAIGIQAIKAGYKTAYLPPSALQDPLLQESAQRTVADADLLILDDLGLKKISPDIAETILDLLLSRYEKKATLVTSNRPIEDWGKMFGDHTTATAILDRLLHHAHVIKIAGKSYRMQHFVKRKLEEKTKGG